MVNLKNQALRDRHWQQIIQETNMNIDLTNNILTLENIFQMNLHQYNDTIQSDYQSSSFVVIRTKKNIADSFRHFTNSY